MAKPKRNPPSFDRYFAFVVAPVAVVALCLATVLYVGYRPQLEAWWGPAAMVMPALLAMVLMILPIIVYFAILIPPRRKRRTPWYKALFYTSAMLAAERTIDDERSGEPPKEPFWNRSLLSFRGRWVWVTILIVWGFLTLRFVARVTLRRGDFDPGSIKAWALGILSAAYPAVLLVQFTRQIRRKRRRQAQDEPREDVDVARPSGDGIDWTASLQSDRARAAGKESEESE